MASPEIETTAPPEFSERIAEAADPGNVGLAQFVWVMALASFACFFIQLEGSKAESVGSLAYESFLIWGGLALPVLILGGILGGKAFRPLFFLVALTGGAIGGAGIAYVSAVSGNVAAQESREKAVNALAANGMSEAEKTFKQWRATTQENGVAIDWNGAASEIMWIQHLPGATRAFGDGVLPAWRVWAKSASGRLYKVVFTIEGDPPRMAGAPEASSAEELGRELIRANRLDLYDKAGLPRKPA